MIKHLHLLLRGLLFTLIISLFSISWTQAQVAVNSDGSAPDGSAMLDVKANDKGLLMPRLTTTQRVALGSTAAVGLVVYDTTQDKFFYFDGSDWVEFSSGGLWSKNATGDTYLSDASSKVGIGTSYPLYTLDVWSTSSSTWIRSRSLTGIAGLVLDKGKISSNAYLIYNTYNASKWYVGMITNNNFAITTKYDGSGTEFYLDSTGLVGIGTNDPKRTLEVSSASQQVARLSTTESGPSLEFVGSSTTDWSVGLWGSAIQFSSSTDNFANSSDEYVFESSTFHPYSTNTKTLGSSLARWSNTFSVDGNFSGDVTVNRLMAPLTIYDATSGMSNVYITPSTTGSGDSSSLFLAEDHNATYGMYWLYDGNGNDLELWGKSSLTRYGPHIAIDRNSGDVAIGGQTFANGYKLSVEGKVICEELRVDLVSGWPDYVFGKDYKLMSLKELESYINDNGHLPNIPAAEKIDESGLDVGEMQRLMMEKIEELTRYIIEQQKEIESLKIQIQKTGNNETTNLH